MTPTAGGAALVGAFAIALAASVFMALAAPFGTAGEPLAERLGFWILGVGGCLALGVGLDGWLGRAALLRTRPLARRAALIVVVAAVGGLAASVASAVIGRRAIDWGLCWRTIPQITLVGAGLSALLRLARRRLETPPAAVRADDPCLDGLLPLRFSGARLLALEAQDHYVRVHTDRGSDLVLVGFEAALAKIAGLDGQRVHRSWWVSRAAVIGVRRGGGRAVLSLSGGAQAPVSRRYAKGLRNLGWY